MTHSSSFWRVISLMLPSSSTPNSINYKLSRTYAKLLMGVAKTEERR